MHDSCTQAGCYVQLSAVCPRGVVCICEREQAGWYVRENRQRVREKAKREQAGCFSELLNCWVIWLSKESVIPQAYPCGTTGMPLSRRSYGPSFLSQIP